MNDETVYANLYKKIKLYRNSKNITSISETINHVQWDQIANRINFLDQRIHDKFPMFLFITQIVKCIYIDAHNDDFQDIKEQVHKLIPDFVNLMNKINYTPIRRKIREIFDIVFADLSDRAPIESFLNDVTTKLISVTDSEFIKWWTVINSHEYCELIGNDAGLRMGKHEFCQLILLCVNCLCLSEENGFLDIFFVDLKTRLSTTLPNLLCTSFSSNDTLLIELLSRLIKLYSTDPIKYAEHFSSAESPHSFFITFYTQIVCSDESIVLDFLISDESGFLEYFIMYFRIFDDENEFAEFKSFCEHVGCFEEMIDSLQEVKRRVEKLFNDKMFPYDPSALVRRLSWFLGNLPMNI